MPILSIIIFLLLPFGLSCEEKSLSCAQIIYINGASSSGKSTLSKALQEALDEPYLHIGIDSMIAMMPAKVNNWQGEGASQGFSWKCRKDASGRQVQELQIGPFAKKLSDTFKGVVVAMAKMGNFIIVDDVSYGKTFVDQWKEALKDYSVLWGRH